MKKKISIINGIVILVAAVALSLYSGYEYGYNAHIEETKVPKGDGKHFFITKVKNYDDTGDYNAKLIYHSTLECKTLKSQSPIYNMDKFDYKYKNDSNRAYPVFYCADCMTEELISNCKEKISANKHK